MARVAVFGNNQEGQTGVGTGEDSLRNPVLLDTFDPTTVVKMCASLKHTFLLTRDGSVLTCGDNENNELGRSVGKRSVLNRLEALEGFQIVDVALGEGFCILVEKDGRAISWGRNDSGQLGLGEGERGNVSKPRPCNVLREGLLSVATGSSHSVAIARTGLVYSWGANRVGQLGDGQLTSSAAPKVIPQLRHRPVVAIACGAEHTLALTVGGSVWAWGCNSSGQLGLGDATHRLRPEIVRALRVGRASNIACGKAHSAAISQAGLLFSWGSNAYGQLGHGDPDAQGLRTVLTPKVVERLSERATLDIALGAGHSLVLASSGGGLPAVYVMGNAASLVSGLGLTGGPYHTPTLLPAERIFSQDSFTPLFVSTGCLANHSFVYSNGCTSLQRSPLPLVDLNMLRQAATRFKASVGDSEKDKALKNLREIVAAAFGSVSVLNASFRLPMTTGEASGGGGALCINLSAVRQAYQLLVSVASEPLLATLGRATVQVTNDLTSVPWDDAENLSCFLIILENPLLLSGSTMAVPLERLANGVLALPSATQATLFGWLRAYPSEYLGRVVNVWQGWLSYCVTSLESKVAVACKVLSIVYAINVTAGRIVPDSLFVNDTVCRRVDWAAERRKFIEAASSGPGGNQRVFNFLNHPFLLSLRIKATFLRADFHELQALQQHRSKLKFLQQQQQQQEQQPGSPPPRPPIGCVLFSIQNDSAEPGWELHCELVVRRDFLLQDLLTQLVAIVLADRDVLRLPLKARFVGEDGVDQGGVRKELFSVAMRELVTFTKVLAPTSDRRFLWFIGEGAGGEADGSIRSGADEKRPRLESDGQTGAENEAELRTLLALLESALLATEGGGAGCDASRGPASACSGTFALGFIQGLAAFHGCQLDLRLPPFLFKLLGSAVEPSSSSPVPGHVSDSVHSPSLLGLSDLFGVDLDLASSLQALLDHNDTSTSLVDVFGATFCCSRNPLLGDLGVFKGSCVELVPNGASLGVDRANRSRFVQLFCVYALHGCCRAALSEYLEGLRFLFKGRTVDQLCQPTDLEVLLCGSRDLGDLSALRLSTTYRGGLFNDEHPIINWFWEAVSDFTVPQQRSFLQFCTGSDRVPAGGLAEVRLQIQHTGAEPAALPSAHTCFNLLDLPLSYPSQDWLRSKLLLAIEYTPEGFGLV